METQENSDDAYNVVVYFFHLYFVPTLQRNPVVKLLINAGTRDQLVITISVEGRINPIEPTARGVLCPGRGRLIRSILRI